MCYALWGDITVTKLVLRGSGLKSVCFVLVALRRYQCNKVGSEGFRNSAFVLCVYALRRYHCNKVGSAGVPVFELLHCVLHALRRYHCNKVGSMGFRNYLFLLCFTCFEAISVSRSWFCGSAWIKLLHCVLHALRRYQCNKVGSAGVPAFSFCIVFYTLWGDTTVPKLVPQECTN